MRDEERRRQGDEKRKKGEEKERRKEGEKERRREGEISHQTTTWRGGIIVSTPKCTRSVPSEGGPPVSKMYTIL